jgi:TIR domain
VASTEWRDFLEPFGTADMGAPASGTEIPAQSCGSTTILYPVALHRAAYQLPGQINRLNYLRVTRAIDPSTWSKEQRLSIEQDRLISLLTQACCRLLWARQTGGGHEPEGPGLPVKVFISHAKADGVAIAEDIRLQILQQGQMQAFFDESDLAIGYGFAPELERSASSTSTAMIAVNTDAYAGRPWCQKEIRLARKPRPVTIDGQERPNCWRAKPLLVVDALSAAPTRYLSEFGYATVVRWQPMTVRSIADRFLREILIYAYNEERAKNLAVRDGRHSLNCLDLYAAMEIKSTDPNNLTELVVPPPGYPRPDREELQRLLAGLKIRTFDEVEDGNHE